MFRWYRSAWGRYTQLDPMDGATYAYAKENPIDFIDPDGLMSFTWFYPNSARLSSNPSGDCHGASTRVACTDFQSLSLHCSCHCDINKLWIPDVVMTVSLRMSILNRPNLRGMAQDTSIVDFASAVAHEENVHLNPSAKAVEDWLRTWVKADYPTKADCETDCKAVSQQTVGATGKFKGKLAETQRNGN